MFIVTCQKSLLIRVEKQRCFLSKTWNNKKVTGEKQGKAQEKQGIQHKNLKKHGCFSRKMQETQMPDQCVFCYFSDTFKNNGNTTLLLWMC